MIYKVKFDNCVYYFKLEEVLKRRKVSKYLLEKDTGVDHKTIQKYCLGNLQRIDMRAVATFCEYLDCDFSDIVSFERIK